jgi:protease PrsW
LDILLALIASFLAAFIPTCVYVGVAWWLDRYEKEPLWLLAITFLWGAVPAIIVSLVLEVVLDIPVQLLVTGQGADLVSVAVIAPVVEEAAKAFPLLLLFILYRREFDGLMDGLIYGALVGFGFAMTENIFYFLGAYAEGGWGSWGILVFMRAIIFGLNHALFTSAFGVGLGYARYARRRRTRLLAPALGWCAAVGLHMVHNLFVSLPGLEFLCLVSLFSNWLAVIAWVGLMIMATREEKRWIIEELAEEVQDGLLPAEHAAAAASYRARLRDRWQALNEHGFGRAHRLSVLHDAAAKLALTKRQYQIHGDEDGNVAAIAMLRRQISKLVDEIDGPSVVLPRVPAP